MVLAAGSHLGGGVRQTRPGLFPVGTALSCAEGSTCPPMGITRDPESPGLRCAAPRNRSFAALRPVKACFCLTCGWVVLRTRPLIVAVRGPDPSTHAPGQGHAVAGAPLFRGPAHALFGVDGPPSTGCDGGGLARRGRKEVAT